MIYTGTPDPRDPLKSEVHSTIKIHGLWKLNLYFSPVFYCNCIIRCDSQKNLIGPATRHIDKPAGKKSSIGENRPSGFIPYSRMINQITPISSIYCSSDRYKLNWHDRCLSKCVGNTAVSNAVLTRRSGMKRMNTATPVSYNILMPELHGQHPASLLFECMEQRFGETLAQLDAKRGTIICNQGTKLSCLYLIKQGEVKLTRLSPDGQETLLSILGPGDFFGEGSLLSRTPVTFSASVIKRSILLQLPERKFKLIAEDPQTCRILLTAVARRCDDAWTQMEVLGCVHVRDKVRSGLLWLSGRIGVETHEGVRIDLNLTQMARMVGCARETLSREVRELRRLRAIDVRYNNGRISFFVVNPEGLS
jgi:CRP-like cAMP-binding protein